MPTTNTPIEINNITAITSDAAFSFNIINYIPIDCPTGSNSTE